MLEAAEVNTEHMVRGVGDLGLNSDSVTYLLYDPGKVQNVICKTGMVITLSYRVVVMDIKCSVKTLAMMVCDPQRGCEGDAVISRTISQPKWAKNTEPHWKNSAWPHSTHTK